MVPPEQRATGVEGVVASVAAGLRARGERMTQPRRAVVSTLAATGEHLSAEQVLADAARTHPGVNRSTVYRALEALSDLGVVQHVHSSRAATVYHLTGEGGEHAHATCDGCGAVIDLPPDALAAVGRQLEQEHGFALDPGHVALAGRCRDCV